MVRKLAGTLATVGMLSSPLVFALGLGEAELISSLNQPFKATIQLAQTQGVEANSIRVQLADERAFAKAGLDRQFFLQNLSFSVLDGATGPYIQLSSTQPVKEPFLNFLLQVEWPEGRLMREYTFLLDPPTYNSAPTPSAALSSSSQSSPISTPAAQKVVDEGARRIKVGSTDTLWSLARKNRPDNSVTIKQAMLAIQDANPDAFPTSNINNMEAGSTILIPSRASMVKRSELEAIREVARQNRAWVAFKARSVPAPVKPAEAAESKPLKLVAEAEEAKTPQMASADLSEELALSKESLDQSEREKAELSSRLDELQKQVSTLQKLIRLKDEQLAAMEAMLDKQNQLLSGKSVAEQAPSVPEPEAVSAVVPSAPVATAASAAATGQVAAGAIGLDLAAESAKQNVAEGMASENNAEEQKSVEAQPEPEPEVKPEPVKSFSLDKQETQELDPSSFLVDTLRKNSTVIGGAAAAVLGLILILMVMRRRRKSADADAEKKKGADESGAADLAAGAAAGVAGVAALDALSDDLPDDLSLDDDLSADLNDDLSASNLDDQSDMGELSLDDLGEDGSEPEVAGNEIEDLGDFDLGDLDADEPEEDSGLDDALDLNELDSDPLASADDSAEDEDLALDDDLDLGDLDFSEDFDLEDLEDGDDQEDPEAPFAQAELTESTVEALEADNGGSAQDNLIDLDLDELERLQSVEQPAYEEPESIELDDLAALEVATETEDASDDLIDLEGEDLSDLDLELLDSEGEEAPDNASADELLAELTDEAQAFAADVSVGAEAGLEVDDLDFDLADLSPDIASESVEGNDSNIESGADDLSEADESQVQAMLDEAQSYRDQGEPEQAAAVLQRALAENPDNNPLRLGFMEVLVELGDEATFDHELRLLQNTGDASSLTSALELQQELYSQSKPELPVEPSKGLEDPGSSEVNTELDDLDFELTDLDLGDDSDADEPMISLSPVDLGEPEPLQTEDFEFTELSDLESDDLELEIDDESSYEFDENQQALRSDAQEYINDLGDLSMSGATTSSDLELADLDDLAEMDLTEIDSSSESDILDLSPSIEDEDFLADLGELSDISLDEPEDDQLNIDGLLDENEDPEIKLDLARAYMDMENTSSAMDALEDVLKRGNADQRQEAEALIAKLNEA